MGAIGRANLDGTGVDQNFIPGVDSPYGLAINSTHVYWATSVDGPRRNAIGRANLDGTGAANLDGTGAQPKFIRPSDPPQPCGVEVDALRSFSFAAVERNKEKGTAELTLRVPGPGTLKLARTDRVKATEKRARAAGKKQLLVKPTREASERLMARGAVRARAKVTYRPGAAGPNIVANSLTKPVTLVMRD